MKTKHLTDELRRDRRDAILWGREDARAQHKRRRHYYVQYHTTAFERHSSERQRARYARQLAAGQLNIASL